MSTSWRRQCERHGILPVWPDAAGRLPGATRRSASVTSARGLGFGSASAPVVAQAPARRCADATGLPRTSNSTLSSALPSRVEQPEPVPARARAARAPNPRRPRRHRRAASSSQPVPPAPETGRAGNRSGMSGSSAMICPSADRRSTAHPNADVFSSICRDGGSGQEPLFARRLEVAPEGHESCARAPAGPPAAGSARWHSGGS